MNDCLFCKIAKDSQNLVWENTTHAAFKDIHPKAKTHILVVPKDHVDSLDHLDVDEAPGLIDAVQQVAKQLRIQGAYRVQVNVGRDGGQEVDHLHAHVLSEK